MTCPTPCDPHCTADCHESHHIMIDQDHTPRTCANLNHEDNQ